MSIPENKLPLQEQSGDPKVNAAGQEVITNKDEADKVVNQDGAIADMDGIQEDLSESGPSTALNADDHPATDAEISGTKSVI